MLTREANRPTFEQKVLGILSGAPFGYVIYRLLTEGHGRLRTYDEFLLGRPNEPGS
ncbi:MAG TPA: hypothetical protein VI997_05345 [Candidatus Thermoplasmatota archaeon]|nr:hypothetical protein [Candidatus Thermoplasmatota archaeon]